MNIDKIFIINLEYRIDRKVHIENELKKQNITNYEFFKAIKPSINDVNNWNQKFCENKNDNYKIGCLGCLLSHYEIIKISLKRNYKCILILEDDTVFKNNFTNLLNYSTQLNHNFDMLYLSGSHLGNTNKISENIIKINGTYTTGSYLITNDAMNYFVNNIKNYNKEVDVFLAENIQPYFNCFCVIPHLTTQLEGFSDIQNKYVSYELNDKVN